MRALAQIPESEASAGVKEIYDDMRRVMRVPLVNLIYRHMATMPGALPWVWSVVRPLVLSGAIQESAGRMVAALDVPALTAMTDEELRSARLDAEAEERARRVIAAYNRGNTFNLISLTTLRLALDGDPIAEESRPAEPAPQFEPPEIPPIREAADLDEGTAARLDTIARLHHGGGALPSFYLHLANWPGFLAVVCDHLEPPLRDGRISRARDAARRLARDEAVSLAPLLTAASPPPTAYLLALREALDTFADHLIPEMVPVGLAVARAMPNPARGGQPHDSRHVP